MSLRSSSFNGWYRRSVVYERDYGTFPGRIVVTESLVDEYRDNNPTEILTRFLVGDRYASGA